MPKHETTEYFSGNQLYRDDFDENELLEWIEDEVEGYGNLGPEDVESYAYGYDALNKAHSFCHLPAQEFGHVLSPGGAWGYELQPLIRRIEKIVILQPSELFDTTEISGIPVKYVKPSPTGALPFDDASFQLMTCFGTLYHIPNVTKVVNECFKSISPGGYMLIRDPIVSMGDWRQRRRGLTRRERGIPAHVLRVIVGSARSRIVGETKCTFPVIQRLGKTFGRATFNSPTLVKLDRLLSWVFSWNGTYHATNLLQKLWPTSVCTYFRSDLTTSEGFSEVFLDVIFAKPQS